MPRAEQIELIKPTEGLCAAYIEFGEDYLAAGESFPRYQEESVRLDFRAYVRRLRGFARGIGLPEGYVPETICWLVRDGRQIIGTTGLRHRLTPALRDVGGHVGYTVRPSVRRRGYGTLMLRLALEKARQLGLGRVLITCDLINIASARVIQKNGGVLASESPSQADGVMKQRYWIDLRTGRDTSGRGTRGSV